jgi:hypothetical protein
MKKLLTILTIAGTMAGTVLPSYAVATVGHAPAPAPAATAPSPGHGGDGDYYYRRYGVRGPYDYTYGGPCSFIWNYWAGIPCPVNPNDYPGLPGPDVVAPVAAPAPGPYWLGAPAASGPGY